MAHRDHQPPGGTVGERIRSLLSERRMSQRQLAAALAGDGATAAAVENVRRQVSSWVNDQHAPSPENAEAIAHQLDVPVAWLITAPPRKNLSAALEELGHVVDLLNQHVEKETARSRDGVLAGQSVDRRLADIEDLLAKLVAGQTVAADALAELLERTDAGQEGQAGKGAANRP